MRLHTLLIIALVTLIAAACASIQQQDPLARAAVIVATDRVIDRADEGERAERAERIETIAGNLAEDVAQAPEATLDHVEQAARDAIPWHRLTASERVLVDALVETIRAELEQRVGEGLLDGKQRVAVATVLEWVAEGAALRSGGP